MAKQKYKNKKKTKKKTTLTFKSVTGDALNLGVSSQAKNMGFLGGDSFVSCVKLMTYCILLFVPTH